jgi:hypothetical protein
MMINSRIAPGAYLDIRMRSGWMLSAKALPAFPHRRADPLVRQPLCPVPDSENENAACGVGKSHDRLYDLGQGTAISLNSSVFPSSLAKRLSILFPSLIACVLTSCQHARAHLVIFLDTHHRFLGQISGQARPFRKGAYPVHKPGSLAVAYPFGERSVVRPLMVGNDHALFELAMYRSPAVPGP